MGQDDRQQHIPNWLRQMRGWEETPDWLLRFIEQSEGSLSLDELGGGFGADAFGTSADETPLDGELAQEGEWFDRLSSEGTSDTEESEESAPSPTVSESGEDWLSEMTEVFDTSLEASAGDDSLDWLDQFQSSQDESLPVGAPQETSSFSDVTPEAGEGASGDLAASELAQESVPDWLAGLDQGFPKDTEKEDTFSWGDTEKTFVSDDLSEADAEVPAEEENAEDAGTGGLPDWLVGEDDVEPEMPEWMSALGEGESAGGGAADWLSQIEAAEEAPPAETADTGPTPTTPPLAEPAAEDLSVSETPAWLTGLAAEGPLDEESADESPGIGAADWLAGMAPDEAADLASLEPLPEGASVSETPDWLTGLAEETPLATVPADETPEADSVIETPDWLTDLAEEAPIAAEPAGEALDGEPADWLAGIAPDEAEDLVSLQPLPEDDSVAETPDWLAGLGQEAPLAEEDSVEFVDEGVPDWLSTLESPDLEAAPSAGLVPPTPDWLLALEGEETDVSISQPAPSEIVAEPDSIDVEPIEEPQLESEDETTEPEIDLGMFDEGAPDWLVDAGEMPSLEKDTAASDSDDGVPAWLSDLDMAAEEQAGGGLDEIDLAGLEGPGVFVSDEEPLVEDETASSVPETGAAGQESDLPDWLINVNQHIPVATEAPILEEASPGLPEEPAPLPAKEEEGPDWLQDMGDVVSSGMPQERKGVTAWLQDVQDMPVPEETVSDQEGDDVEIPSWLQDMDLGMTESEEAPSEVSASLDDMPDWLREMPQEDVSGVSGSVTEEAAPATLGESSMQGAPSWMQEVYEVSPHPVPDALDLPVQEVAAAEESPEWLEALREQDQAPEEDQLPVETSGPLAGLRGVLNPEPLLAILPKATYKPVPPVEEAQQSEAQRVAELLALPVRRTQLTTVSPGRAILASLGRWLIYIALVAVMLIAPLQLWVRPPVRSEAQGFYYAIDALQPGSEVLVVVDYDASLDGELTPQLRAIIWHLLHRNLGIVFLSLDAQGPAIIRDILAEIPSAIAGEHYLDLGYVPAQPASLRGFVHNPIAGAKTLVSGDITPADTTLGRRIASFDDLDLMVTVTGDHKHVQWWIEQVGIQTRADLLAAVSTSAVPYLMPYYDARGTGQLAGILSGLSGAVQYEQLAAGEVMPKAWPNYVVLVNGQMLLVVVILLSGTSSLVSGIIQRTRRHK